MSSWSDVVRHYFRETRDLMRSDGIRFTIRKIVGTLVDWIIDSIFEWRYRNSTSRISLLSELGVGDAVPQGASYYSAASYRILRKLLPRVDRKRYGDVLIDFGCGRGRALVVAEKVGFRHLIGVEFSESLCRGARSSLSEVSQLPGRTVDIVHTDAAKFKIPENASVFYFYNPFGEATMRQVLSNIHDSLRENSRDACILYIHSLHRQLLPDFGFSEEYSVYQAGEWSHVYKIDKESISSIDTFRSASERQLGDGSGNE